MQPLTRTLPRTQPSSPLTTLEPRPPQLSAAADYFGFDEDQKDQLLGGYISAAFFAVGAPAALLVGWLTDKMNRRNLLFIVAVLGQAPCLCTIFVSAVLPPLSHTISPKTPLCTRTHKHPHVPGHTPLATDKRCRLPSTGSFSSSGC
jgi:MFS family permease